jgi:pimeloyl-ACP methyl ester carboxylesterase
MTSATDERTGLAFDITGSGTPVVFVHGLTFDRRTWQPIIEELGGTVRSVAIDLPAHGGSHGEPVPLQEVADQVHQLVQDLGLERPVVVGHSIAAAVAGLYAAAYPTRGIVFVDQATEVLPFARMLHQVAPMLRGPAFGQIWPSIEDSLGVDHIPEPVQSIVRQSHVVDQQVVLRYWNQVLTTDPVELQAWIDDTTSRIHQPCLAVFGRQATGSERERLRRLPDVQIEEWDGDGHCVHLVDPGRFATRLRAFIDHCERSRVDVRVSGAAGGLPLVRSRDITRR